MANVETNVLMIGWNRACPGREAVAAELFGTTVAYYEKLVKAGKLTSWEPFFLEQHAGDLNGFFLLRGTKSNLDALRNEDEFVDFIMRATHCLQNVGVIAAWTGMATIQDLMTRWTKTIPR